MNQERNIAAMVRDDTYTVKVKYSNQSDTNRTLYSYVATFPLEVGDEVVVSSIKGLSIAYVAKVDDFLDIEPGSEMKYEYVLQKLDREAIDALIAKNKAIEEIVADQYKQRAKQGFRAMVTSGLTYEGQEKLKALGLNL